jgi:hypothetical protein
MRSSGDIFVSLMQILFNWHFHIAQKLIGRFVEFSQSFAKSIYKSRHIDYNDNRIID